MVDIHHHLLPGLDDGAPDLQTTLDMARMAADDGITHIVATPHANDHYQFDRPRNEQMLADLREKFAAERIPITLGSGCDFHLSYDNIRDATRNPTRYTINEKKYLLIELPDHSISPQIEDSYYELRRAGMTLILTHPERNPTMQRDYPRLAEWLKQDVLVQVTASSVLGHMGPAAEKMAHRLLADHWVHFLATDAHNINRRRPKMSEARNLVAQKYGADYATALCVTHPLAVFEGRPLPPYEEPRGIYEPKKKSFFQRVFGR
jgi:protein-tyrosine phosphatase